MSSNVIIRHCEEHSDEAIHIITNKHPVCRDWCVVLRTPRNDGTS